MSSSKGRGVTARQMADFLPPEILRYLMLRTVPKKSSISNHQRSTLQNSLTILTGCTCWFKTTKKVEPWEETIYKLSQIFYHEPFRVLDFSLIATLVQLPYIDIFAEARKRLGSDLTDIERLVLQKRMDSAKYLAYELCPWSREIPITENFTGKSKELNAVQIAFCTVWQIGWKTSSLLKKLFKAGYLEVTRHTPKSSKQNKHLTGYYYNHF